MATATINGTVVAESDETIIIEGNHYFPPASVQQDLFAVTDHSTVCGWKGTASYYDLTVDGETHTNVAWFYPEPMDGASEIKDYVAFYPKVTVTD